MTGTIDKYGNADKGYLLSSEVTGERNDCLSYTTTTAPVTDQVPVAYGVSVRCVKD